MLQLVRPWSILGQCQNVGSFLVSVFVYIFRLEAGFGLTLEDRIEYNNHETSEKKRNKSLDSILILLCNIIMYYCYYVVVV